MGIVGVQECLERFGGVRMAPHIRILTNKTFVPPTMVGRLRDSVVTSSRGRGRLGGGVCYLS